MYTFIVERVNDLLQDSHVVVTLLPEDLIVAWTRRPLCCQYHAIGSSVIERLREDRAGLGDFLLGRLCTISADIGFERSVIEVIVAVDGIAFLVVARVSVPDPSHNERLDFESCIDGWIVRIDCTAVLEVASAIRWDVTAVHYHVEPRHAAMFADDAVVTVPLDGYVHVVQPSIVRSASEIAFRAVYIVEVCIVGVSRIFH